MAEKIVRKDWVSNFNLVGRPVIGDYTYKIDEQSEKSNWVYNAMNLGVDCSDKYGTIYCELMGGYSEDNENKIYAHGKNDDGSDDFEKQIIVDWEDRFNQFPHLARRYGERVKRLNDKLENFRDTVLNMGPTKNKRYEVFVKYPVGYEG